MDAGAGHVVVEICRVHLHHAGRHAVLLDRSRFGWPLVLAGMTKAGYDLLLLAQPVDRD